MRKGLRFDIFRRDGFTCRYCGSRPPDVVLEVDHVVPRVDGGDDDPLNLVTACWDCNRGKSAKRLDLASPAQPDADLEYLAVQQEIAEIRRYIDAKAARDLATDELIYTLGDHWVRTFDVDPPDDGSFRRWLTHYSPDEIEEAMTAAAGAWAGKYISGGRWGLERYVAGIMKANAGKRG